MHGEGGAELGPWRVPGSPTAAGFNSLADGCAEPRVDGRVCASPSARRFAGGDFAPSVFMPPDVGWPAVDELAPSVTVPQGAGWQGPLGCVPQPGPRRVGRALHRALAHSEAVFVAALQSAAAAPALPLLREIGADGGAPQPGDRVPPPVTRPLPGHLLATVAARCPRLETLAIALTPAHLREDLSVLEPLVTLRHLALHVDLDRAACPVGARGPALPSLPFLASLHLTGRGGALRLPDTLWALSRLVLGHADLDPSTLAELCSLPALTALALAPAPAARVSRRPLTDAVLTRVGGLTGLRELHLAPCDAVTSEGFAQLGRLAALTSLHLDGAAHLGDAELVSLLARTPRLAALCLTDAGRLRGETIGPTLAGLADLTALTFARCPLLRDAGLAALGRGARLRRLTFEHCLALAAVGLREVGGCRELEQLQIRAMPNLSNTVAQALPTLAGLVAAELCGCTGLTDEQLLRVRSLDRLRTLRLDGAVLLRGPGLAAVGQLPQVESVSLRGAVALVDLMGFGRGSRAPLRRLSLARCTALADGSLAPLADRATLTTLNLDGCTGLSDYSAAGLLGCTSLRELGLTRWPRLTDQALLCLARLPHLAELALDGSPMITDDGLQALAGAPALEHVSLVACPRVTQPGLRLLNFFVPLLTPHPG